MLDATPLIHLAKTRLHGLLSALEVEIFTTPTVKEEATRGAFGEKPVLEGLLRETIRIQKPAKNVHGMGLHAGEASAIALARQKKAILVCDDRVARTVAKANGVTVVHTTYFIYRALAKKRITLREAERLLAELVESGWYCDSLTLSRITNALADLGS